MRRTDLKAMSDKQRKLWAERGNPWPTSTFLSRKPKAGKRTDTGPKRSVCQLVDARSGGVCEWPGCTERATDRHHRLNRKAGGRHGEMRDLVNGPAWLLAACRVHHAYVTSPVGQRRRNAIAVGWLLLEGQDAAHVPVWTRHNEGQPVWLTPAGLWVPFEEACA